MARPPEHVTTDGKTAADLAKLAEVPVAVIRRMARLEKAGYLDRKRAGADPSHFHRARQAYNQDRRNRQQVTLHLPPEIVSNLDKWATCWKVSRSEAARRLLQDVTDFPETG